MTNITPAPSFHALIEARRAADPASMQRVYARFLELDDSAYLHWDELRHKTPLVDRDGAAFVYTLPDHLLERLAQRLRSNANDATGTS